MAKKYNNNQRKKMAKEKVWLNFKAKTLYQVFLATGKIDKKEALRRFKPKVSSNHAHEVAEREFDEMVMAKFAELIKVQDKDLKRLTSTDRILKELCEDINRLNLMLESNEITADEAVKIIKAKTDHLKLLGLSQGAWKKEGEGDDKPKEPHKDLFGRLNKRFDN